MERGWAGRCVCARACECVRARARVCVVARGLLQSFVLCASSVDVAARSRSSEKRSIQSVDSRYRDYFWIVQCEPLGMPEVICSKGIYAQGAVIPIDQNDVSPQYARESLHGDMKGGYVRHVPAAIAGACRGTRIPLSLVAILAGNEISGCGKYEEAENDAHARESKAAVPCDQPTDEQTTSEKYRYCMYVSLRRKGQKRRGARGRAGWSCSNGRLDSAYEASTPPIPQPE
jgi:hypothetical protein